MTDRRKTTDYETETFQDPDAPDVDVQQGRPDPVQGDASPEAERGWAEHRWRGRTPPAEADSPASRWGFSGRW